MNQSTSTFALKGNIIYSDLNKQMHYQPDAYLVCENNKTAGIFPELPEKFSSVKVTDYSGQLIIPGMTDLHVHAPQYTFRGLGMDLELIDWLNQHTFPEEAKYQDISYAQQAYHIFTKDLVKSPTTRACIFATLHVDATLCLMDELEASGLKTYVGKVNMDRNGTRNLQESSAEASYLATKDWLLSCQSRYQHTRPILTPRFIPSCTDALMHAIKKLQQAYHLPVQSHLSENLDEIKWVQQLVPESRFYGDAYAQFGLFGKDVPTIMAHCVHCCEDEIQLIRANRVYIAHCPESNINLSSGIAPIRRYLNEGIHVGLGSDVAAGSSLSLFKALVLAIQVSKLYYRLIDSSMKPLTFEEAFYLATLGGGQFFGKAGSFLPGYEFDALILDDHQIHATMDFNLAERLQRAIYASDQLKITAKYVAGLKLCLD